VLSLAVTASGRAVHGELFDPETGRKGRFAGLTGLTRLLRSWLGSNAESREAVDHEAPGRELNGTGR
jgi:hypothetical protein